MELGNFVMLVVITDSITQSARNENFFIPVWFFANFIVIVLEDVTAPATPLSVWCFHATGIERL